VSRAVLALGANLGDRAAALQGALEGLAERVRIVAVSAIFATEPVGGPEQPEFYNAVVVVDTDLSAGALLDLAHRLEDAAGRRRTVRWGPRTLDVDIVTVDGERSDDPALTLPHPRAHERAFVLLPWLDADPHAVLPGHGPVIDISAALHAGAGGARPSGVRRLDSPRLRAPGPRRRDSQR
jgi:2-amino-4-hydroxy-6-hydroxymethyldihydropteridine diphosphokinase